MGVGRGRVTDDLGAGASAPVPLVTVVIPAYDAAGTLGEALESLVRQDFAGWEALVVDDGSSDATVELAAGWAAREPRIRLRRHPGGRNLGRGASRNLGVAHARGEIVAFLDADDALAAHALATYSETFAAHSDAGVVYGQARLIEGGDPEATLGRGLPGTPASMLRQLARFNPVVTSATAVRRRVLPEEPFATDVAFPIEDWVCWLEVARRWPFVFVPAVLAAYRRHAAGGTEQVKAAGEEPAYELALANLLRLHLAAGDARERKALRDGLRFRAAYAFQMTFAAFRRGRLRRAARWLSAASRIGGGAGNALAALSAVPSAQLRVWRGREHPLTIAAWA